MSDGFQCINCRGSDAAPFLENCRDLYLRTAHVVSCVRCSSCNLVQQHPIPADTSVFYLDYPVHQRKNGLVQWIRRSVMQPAYMAVKDLPQGATLLDFGCGDGAYLEWIAAAPIGRVGFEPGEAHAQAVAQRLGIPVYHDLRRLLADYGGKLDVVTLHSVLEHVTDLHGTFQNVSGLLKRGGVCYCMLPYIDSFGRRFFGRHWHALDPPRHISFPDERVIGSLASAYGLKLVRHRPVAFPPAIAGSIPTWLLGRFSQIGFMAAMPLAVILAHLIPTGYRAYWLEKA